jgi:NADH:ubiquinone oxidoreductase subunit B-like Fe-S oxidoreductase
MTKQELLEDLRWKGMDVNTIQFALNCWDYGYAHAVKSREDVERFGQSLMSHSSVKADQELSTRIALQALNDTRPERDNKLRNKS